MQPDGSRSSVRIARFAFPVARAMSLQLVLSTSPGYTGVNTKQDVKGGDAASGGRSAKTVGSRLRLCPPLSAACLVGRPARIARLLFLHQAMMLAALLLIVAMIFLFTQSGPGDDIQEPGMPGHWLFALAPGAHAPPQRPHNTSRSHNFVACPRARCPACASNHNEASFA